MGTILNQFVRSTAQRIVFRCKCIGPNESEKCINVDGRFICLMLIIGKHCFITIENQCHSGGNRRNYSLEKMASCLAGRQLPVSKIAENVVEDSIFTSVLEGSDPTKACCSACIMQRIDCLVFKTYLHLLNNRENVLYYRDAVNVI